MERENPNSDCTRRQFLKQGTAAGCLVGVATALGNDALRAAPPPPPNPFAYDVRRFTKTDPNLVQYRETGRVSPLREDARRLAVGPNDQLYVAAGKRVSVLDQTGVVLSEIVLEETVRCLTVCPDGELFVGLQDHVEIVDAKGRVRGRWNSLGPRTWLTGVAVAGEDVFLADAGNRVVLRCDRAGKVVKRIGEKNADRNIPGFIIPSPFFDVEIHRDGLLRVTNPGRHRVEAYTPDGDLEFSWGNASTGISGFCGCCNPINIALLEDGRAVTCEKGLPRVKVYRTDGVFESVVAGPESFPESGKIAAESRPGGGPYGGLDVGVSRAGRVYILDVAKGDIRVMEPKSGNGIVPDPKPKTPG